MKQKIIAVVGVSGVGKSTLLKALSGEVCFQHLQASQIIKEETRGEENFSLSSDMLRDADIDNNQVKLVEGFRKCYDPCASYVVLDGHTVIDTPEGLVKISPLVFREIGVTRIVMLADDPEVIFARRDADTSRNRPKRTVSEILCHQEASNNQGFKVAMDLSVPFSVLVSPEFSVAKKYIF